MCTYNASSADGHSQQAGYGSVEGAATSIRAHIPVELPRTPDEVDWPEFRENFIATLFARDRAEIDLWPSQLNAVDRVFDSDDDLR